MSEISCDDSAGLPPLGGMATCVVFKGSEVGRPWVMKSTSWASLKPAANLLVCRSLPRCGIPCPCGPWQPVQVLANNCWPCSAEGAAGAAGAAAVCSTGGVCSAAGSAAEDVCVAPEPWPQPLKAAASAKLELKVNARWIFVLMVSLVIILFINLEINHCGLPDLPRLPAGLLSLQT